MAFKADRRIEMNGQSLPLAVFGLIVTSLASWWVYSDPISLFDTATTIDTIGKASLVCLGVGSVIFAALDS